MRLQAEDKYRDLKEKIRTLFEEHSGRYGYLKASMPCSAAKANRVSEKIVRREVRGMRPGERWAPLGMQGRHQKLSDFFINEKIPQGARAKWPLVFSEGSLLWVCGLRIAQAWRLIGDEPEILHLQLIKPQD